MRPLRRNPKGRGFPGDLLCRAARPWGLPRALRRFAHLIPESLRRGHAGLIQRFLSGDAVRKLPKTPQEDDMSDRVRKVDYFYVMVPNTAGQASKVLSGLAEHGVNLLAFSGFPSKGKGQLDLVPENTAAFTRAAKKLKLKVSKRKSGFLLQGSDRVGAMTRTLETLAAA